MYAESVSGSVFLCMKENKFNQIIKSGTFAVNADFV